MVMVEIIKENKTGCVWEDNAVGDCRQVAQAGTSSPAALSVWVIAQADPTHTHLQTLGLLLPMGCSGTRSVCPDTNTALKHLAPFTHTQIYFTCTYTNLLTCVLHISIQLPSFSAAGFYLSLRGKKPHHSRCIICQPGRRIQHLWKLKAHFLLGD